MSKALYREEMTYSGVLQKEMRSCERFAEERASFGRFRSQETVWS